MKWLKIAGWIWMVVCTCFMIYAGVNWFVNDKLQGAFNAGKDQTIESVVAAAKQCKPLEIHGKTEKVTLANLGCPATGEEKK